MKITIAAIVGLNVLVFGVLALVGVPLIHVGSDDTGTGRTDNARYIPLADSSTVPAATVVRGVLTGKIDGAKPAGPLWASSGTPFDKACPDNDDPTPALAYARPFNAGGRTVSVRLAAYGAGQGAAALDALVDRIDSCRSTGATGATLGSTSTAVAAWAQTSNANASMLLWNRGDVVASVTVPRTSPTGLGGIAAAVDESLVTALSGTCAATKVSVRDAGRSPWSVFPYTGNLVPRSIPLVYDDPSESPTPVVPSGATLVPVPGPTFPTPILSTAPTGIAPLEVAPTPPMSTPVDSIGPVTAMTAAPSPPSAPPTASPSAVVGELQPDPTGPGCGWAFAMQGTPSFDPAAAEARFATDVEAARQRLREADARWQVDRVTYSVDYARYVAELREFTRYANEYNAWVERSQGRAYDELLAEYEAAIVFRDEWDESRVAAEQAYIDAIAACEAVGSPVATPTPTEPVDPVEPEATPTSTELLCPPARPEILDEPRPDLPPSPRAPR